MSNLHSGYINQSLEVDEHFPLLTHHDDYDYRTDIYDDEESEEELQFSDDYDVDIEQDGSGSSEDDDDDDVAVFNDDTSDDEGLIMPVRRVSTKTEVVLASNC